MQDEPAKPDADNMAMPTTPEQTGIQAEQPLQPASAPQNTDIPLSPEVARQRLLVADWVLVGLLMVFAFLLGSFAVLVHDVWMHLATGRLIASGNYQFGVDPFSSLTVGQVWVNHSWLFDWLLYKVYTNLGPATPLVLKALLAVALAWMLLQFRDRQQSLLVPVVAVAFAVLVASMRFYLRPEMISYLFMAITLYLLMKNELNSEGVKVSSRHLWILPALFVLWVNLDAWFILGPLTIGLYLIGMLVGRLLGHQTSTDIRTVAAVLGIGLLACLINPHHFRAFVLPPELAYVVVRLPLPSWMTAGGDTLATFQGTSGAPFVRIVSPITASYLTHPLLAGTIAGASLYAFGLIALATFFLPLVGKNGQWNCPLAVLFLAFGFLTLFSDQFVPFFVVAATPCVILNVQDFIRRAPFAFDWQTQMLARGGVGFLLGVLVLAAWPGWLHAPRNGELFERRVCWDFTPSPSLKNAAARLRQLHGTDELKNVWNLSRETPSYVAWFCADEKGLPLVKCFVDHRYALFAKSAPEYAQIRERMLGLTPQTQSAFRKEWDTYAAKHAVDHVVLTGFDVSSSVRVLVLRDLWSDDRSWPLRYSDGRTMIFAWNSAGNGPARLEVFEREAFGATALMPPPQDGAAPPTAAPGFWDTLTHGRGDKPLAADQAAQYEFHRLVSAIQSGNARQLGLWLSETMNGQGLAARIGLLGRINTFIDLGPASAAVLQMRASRQAVRDNPHDFSSQSMLRQACDRMGGQEDSWVRTSAVPVSLRFPTFRQEVRLIQALTALHNMARLQPGNWRVHLDLANLYIQNNYLDLARDHFARAYQAMETVGPGANMNALQLAEQRKQVDDQMKGLERVLEQRRKDFDVRSSKFNAVGKAFVAIKQQYSTLVDNQEFIDTNMGLARLALTQLQSSDVAKLNNEERYLAADWQMELLLKTGEVRQVRELIEDPQQAKQLAALLGQKFQEIRVMAAAAVGDYATAEKALAQLLDRPEMSRITLPYQISLVRQLGNTNLVAMQAILAATFRYRDQQFAGTMQKLADWHMARGLMALEAGNTKNAAASFERCLDQVGQAVNYPDRAVVERYRGLIRGQQEKR